LYTPNINISTKITSLGSYSQTVGSTNRDLYIDNAGVIGYVSSSIKFKENIAALADIDWIYLLNPVTFTYIGDIDKVIQFGLIAEEVLNIKPELVDYHEDGTIATVKYSQLVAPLLAAIKSLNTRITELENIINNG